MAEFKPDWIPCSVQMPEANQFVLISLKQNCPKHLDSGKIIDEYRYSTSVGRYDADKDLWYMHDYFTPIIYPRVIAWATLPEPYNDGNK